jgi:hypothetical protein
MVNLGREAHFGRFEGVVGRERDGKEEDATRIWGVILKVTVSAKVFLHLVCKDLQVP